MNAVTFYQCVLVFPLLVLICSVPIGDRPSLFFHWTDWAKYAFPFGIPYLLALLFFAPVLRRGSEAELRNLTRVLPVVLVVVQVMLGMGISAIAQGIFFWLLPLGFLSVVPTVLFGYLYVYVVTITFLALKRIGWIVSDELENAPGLPNAGVCQ